MVLHIATVSFTDEYHDDAMVSWETNFILFNHSATQLISAIVRGSTPTRSFLKLTYTDVYFAVIIKPDGRVALIDFGQTKEIPHDLRKKLCAFYLALYAGNKLYIMKTFGDLGIELSIPFEDMDDKLKELIPVYANGLLDTAPLPSNIEINPFSSDSPLNELPIKHFNPDLFMVLRTMGLLRALCETYKVTTAMSTVFWSYALKGLWRRASSDEARKRRADDVCSALVSRAASPFSPLCRDNEDSCNMY